MKDRILISLKASFIGPLIALMVLLLLLLVFDLVLFGFSEGIKLSLIKLRVNNIIYLVIYLNAFVVCFLVSVLLWEWLLKIKPKHRYFYAVGIGFLAGAFLNLNTILIILTNSNIFAHLVKTVIFTGVIGAIFGLSFAFVINRSFYKTQTLQTNKE